VRELSDEQIEAMTPEEKAEYARLRAAAKYHNPDLDREGDGGSRRTLFQGLAIAGAVVLVCAAGWMWHEQTSAELDKTRERIAEQNSFKNTHPSNKAGRSR
jgi:cytochrome c-type biogenesis protein CcmH/NrfG